MSSRSSNLAKKNKEIVTMWWVVYLIFKETYTHFIKLLNCWKLFSLRKRWGMLRRNWNLFLGYKRYTLNFFSFIYCVTLFQNTFCSSLWRFMKKYYKVYHIIFNSNSAFYLLSHRIFHHLPYIIFQPCNHELKNFVALTLQCLLRFTKSRH